MITTHVLDTARGVPASGLEVILELRHLSDWSAIGRATTDGQGRVLAFSEAPLGPGTYRMTFDIGTYHRDLGMSTPFFPEVKIVFSIRDAQTKYHIPLLLSPYGYSTYLGS
jgi:5-hydroxyisourate hydrolase